MSAALIWMVLVFQAQNITYAWDYPDLSLGVVDEFRVYLVRDPVELEDLSALGALTVFVPATEILITGLGAGDWYAVVTAVDIETARESPPSNMVRFPSITLEPLSAPLNLTATPSET